MTLHDVPTITPAAYEAERRAMIRRGLPWHAARLTVEPVAGRPPRPATCIETGKVYASLAHAAASVSPDTKSSTIGNAIYRGHRLHGRRWRYATAAEIASLSTPHTPESHS